MYIEEEATEKSATSHLKNIIEAHIFPQSRITNWPPAPVMHIEDLPNELIIAAFSFCGSIRDVLSLASANRRFHHLFSNPRKLSLLFQVAETQYGPLEDAIQVVTYNSSQPAHVLRTAPDSLALLKQLITLGKSADTWFSVYPIHKWDTDFEQRRMLRPQEEYRLRRAIYRLTLYARAFHNSRYTRTGRMLREVILERCSLLHNWSTQELSEMEDTRNVLRYVIEQVCPSNGAISRKFHKRFPNSEHQLIFNLNVHLNYPTSGNDIFLPSQHHFHTTQQISPSSRASLAMSKYVATPHHEPGSEGWGDDIRHYYIVEGIFSSASAETALLTITSDMMKLEPAQMMWLKEHAPLKGMVEVYIKNLGPWFENNGDTFQQTLEWVMNERGEDVEEIRQCITERSRGIVIDDNM